MTECAPPDEETMVKVAVADLDGRFPGVAPARIEAVVRRLVHRWLTEARVKTFVGIISWREARAELEQQVVPES